MRAGVRNCYIELQELERRYGIESIRDALQILAAEQNKQGGGGGAGGSSGDGMLCPVCGVMYSGNHSHTGA